MPVQIVWGEEDGWLDPLQALRLREQIRGSRLELIPEAGHFVQEDASKKVAQELVAFLSENEERV